MAVITIGLSVHNGARHLDETLSSLSKQTFKDFKILISDNASSDLSPEIAGEWMQKDPRIEFFRQKENIGPINSLSWMLEKSITPWFVIAASGDKWSAEYLELLYNAAIKKAGIVSAVPLLATFYEAKTILKRPYLEPQEKARTIDRIRFALNTAHVGWFYGLHNRETLKSAIRGVKRFNHIWGYDYLAICHLILSGEVTGDNQAIYFQRIQPQAQMAYKPNTRNEQFVHYRDFLYETMRALADSSVSAFNKILILPALIHFSRHGEKPARIIKSFIKDLFPRKPVRTPSHTKGWHITTPGDDQN